VGLGWFIGVSINLELSEKFVNNFVFAEDRGRLVLDGKLDRESDGHPICMQRTSGRSVTSISRIN
jgi:hypothetical protein